MSEGNSIIRVVSPSDLGSLLGLEGSQLPLLVVGRRDIFSTSSQLDVYVAEPFTWAWLGIKLAEGVVSYIGGKIFSEAFFPEYSNADVVNALSRKIEEAVRLLQQYIDTRLEQQIIDTSQRKLYSIYTLLREYTNAPRGDAGRLSTVNAEATILWDLLYSRGDAAFIPACLAASVKVAALTTRYKETRDAGDRRNVIEFLDIAINGIGRWLEKIYTANHVFELTPLAVIDCTDTRQCEVEPRFQKQSGDEAAITAPLRCYRVYKCTSSFRANGIANNFESEWLTDKDDSFDQAMSRARGPYENWVARRDVIEPYVNQQLLMPARFILEKLAECRTKVL